jgi:predicted RNase H-like HicB family nuclease
MKSFTAIIERCSDTGLFVGHIPGFPGAHSQGEIMEALNENLKEVVALLLENDPPQLETEFIGTQTVVIP